MVTSIARQSIILKCRLEESVLLGNYEFYYAAGLIGKLTATEFDTTLPPRELYQAVLSCAKAYQPKDEREKYLIHMICGFKPEEEKEEQMMELYQCGLTEERMWQE